MKIVADSAIPFLQGVLEPWAEVRYPVSYTHLTLPTIRLV